MRNIIVVGVIRQLIGEVLLAIRSFSDAACIVVGGSKEAHALRYSTLCAKYLASNFNGADDQRFIEQIAQLARNSDDAVLIAADTQGAAFLNRLRQRLPLPAVAVPSAAALRLFDDKWQFYQFCKEHGLHAPEARLINNKTELDFASMARELGLPLVVKPLSEAASNGVHAIVSEAHYDRTIRNNQAYRYAPLIVQRFIAGTDVGLNLLARQGRLRAVAVQQRIEQQRVGSKIKFIANNYLFGVAQTIAAQSAYDGVMNVDARIEQGSGKVFLFESNPRFWRTLSASVWCGMNFVAECIVPSPIGSEVRVLSSGVADTYYHPLFRPSQWVCAVVDQSWRGRMLRAKLGDPYTLATSTKTVIRAGMAHSSQVMALCGDSI